jgi:ABC-type uncharacterized transport system involved in gliding motility auxiliary subunit
MKSLSRRSFSVLAIVFGVVLFFAINIVSNMWFGAARLDLTQSGLYTVSDGTRETLDNLEEPVTLRFFFSRGAVTGYPTINAYASRVRDLLQEYVALAGGNLHFEEIDPVTFTPEEDEAVAYGLTGVPTQEGEKVYFGLVGTNSTDGQETIAFFNSDREAYLEYDLTSLVYRLSQIEQPRLGVLSALPLESGLGGMMAMMQGNAQPFAIYQQLSDTFDVEMLADDVDRIPEDISTLLVAHPADFSDQTRYAIDQFVLRGGNAIILVDPLSEAAGAASSGMGGQPISDSSDLPELFAAWGIDYDPGQVVTDAELAQRVRFGDAANPQTLQYIVWLRATTPNFDDGDLVTADLQLVNIASAGALSAAEGATTSFTPLITSSATSELANSFVVRSTQNPADLLRNFSPIGGPFTLASRISGPAATGFPDGAPETPLDSDLAPNEPAAPLPDQIREADNINVIVIADSDLLEDRFWVSVQNILGQRILIPNADNGALIINAVENMMGSNELISLRTRAPVQRTFTVVEELQREAEAQFLDQERQLQESIAATEARLLELQGQGGEDEIGAELVTPEQQAAIENFRQELLESRAALRAVQANLRRDQENLGMWLTFINTAAVPLVIGIAAIGVGTIRRRRRLQGRGM